MPHCNHVYNNNSINKTFYGLPMVREKRWHCSKLCNYLMAQAGRLCLYILSQHVRKYKVQHKWFYSTATIERAMSGKEFTAESVDKVKLEKLKG